ncbi:MAG: hypothetical protein L6V93_22405 [Clostridiales bacterium]|nr:MAG: hypothetical protein L6V93_22405 [Clostridiales bacterium]
MDFAFDEKDAIPIDEVESASEIVKRFKNGRNVVRFNFKRGAHLYGGCYEQARRKIKFRRGR